MRHLCRSEKTAEVPAKDSVDQAHSVGASVDGVKDNTSQGAVTKLATESETLGEPGEFCCDPSCFLRALASDNPKAF